MQYIYLNNIRGFTRTLVPIRACNFLVGENSTGKSSFLSLLKLLSKPDLHFQPRFSFGDEASPAGFNDLVSAWAEDKSFFDIGMLTIEETSARKTKLQFHVYRFAEDGGSPLLAQFIQRKSQTNTHLKFSRRITEYLRVEDVAEPNSNDAAVAEFWRAVDSFEKTAADFEKFPKQLEGRLPLGFALALLPSLQTGNQPDEREVQFEVLSGRPLTWIAPIRTKPSRIYDGLIRDYSPEGDHAPFVLKQQLKSAKFVEKLREFGEASGLFEILSTHTFGKGIRNPFEVMIRLSGQSFNIENVGYGVSQVLPLVVEFLSRKEGRRFAVQQPEVHLHPRAQAALGSLLFFLTAERKHTFWIETHSDFLIDRYRLEMNGAEEAPHSQVLFFSRTQTGNQITPIDISQRGQYPTEQPSAFRDFFVREEMRLLSL
ncbi:MAG: AAA family ATPase [Candidimonas sp.]|nr:AAA family ATPase [Candidimonas sp.]